MKQYIDFNPVRFLTALGGLVQAVMLLVAYLQGWAADTLILAEGVQGAFLVLLGSVVVEKKAVSKRALDEYAAIVEANQTALDYAPEINSSALRS